MGLSTGSDSIKARFFLNQNFVHFQNQNPVSFWKIYSRSLSHIEHVVSCGVSHAVFKVILRHIHLWWCKTFSIKCLTSSFAPPPEFNRPKSYKQSCGASVLQLHVLVTVTNCGICCCCTVCKSSPSLFIRGKESPQDHS